MKVCIPTTLMMIAVGLTIPGPAGAQEEKNPPSPPAIEVTPYVSIGSYGSWPIGAAVSFPVASNLSVETEVGFRRAEGNLNALSMSANLLCALPQIGRAMPYLATGAGLSEYGAPVEIFLPGRQGPTLVTQRKLAFEFNAGGGLKVPVGETWDMRTDARWYKSFGKQGSEHWRVSQGISFDVRTR